MLEFFRRQWWNRIVTLYSHEWMAILGFWSAIGLIDQLTVVIILEEPFVEFLKEPKLTKRDRLSIKLLLPFTAFLALHPIGSTTIYAIAEHGLLWFPLLTMIRYRCGPRRRQDFEFGMENIRSWVVVPCLFAIPFVVIKWVYEQFYSLFN